MESGRASEMTDEVTKGGDEFPLVESLFSTKKRKKARNPFTKDLGTIILMVFYCRSTNRAGQLGNTLNGVNDIYKCAVYIHMLIKMIPFSKRNFYFSSRS